MGTIQKDSAGNSYIHVPLFAGEQLVLTMPGGGWNGSLRVQHSGVTGALGPAFVIPVRCFGGIVGALVRLLENRAGIGPDDGRADLGSGEQLQLTFVGDGATGPHRVRARLFPQDVYLGQEISSEYFGAITDAVVQLLANQPGHGRP